VTVKVTKPLALVVPLPPPLITDEPPLACRFTLSPLTVWLFWSLNVAVMVRTKLHRL
jgi:hypothetical protein